MSLYWSSVGAEKYPKDVVKLEYKAGVFKDVKEYHDIIKHN